MRIGDNTGVRSTGAVGEAKPAAPPAGGKQDDVLGPMTRIGGDVLKNMANQKLNTAAKTGEALVGSLRRGLDPEARARTTRAMDAGVDKLTQAWPKERKEALTRTLDTLHRMAGADGMFNHGDVAGIRADATRSMGTFGRAAAGPVIERRLNGTLGELGVDPQTKDPADAAGRRGLTKEKLSALEGDMATLQEAFGGDPSALGEFLKKHVDLGAHPLGAGVPSPKDPLAILQTALRALGEARIK